MARFALCQSSIQFRYHTENASLSLSQVNRARIGIALGAFTLVALHLAWEMSQGGVRSHHFLARSDMPSMSNWWGIVLVPALAWFVAGRVQSRAASGIQSDGAIHASIRHAIPAFAGALLYGGALAVSYSYGLGLEHYLFMALFAIGLVLPIYRGEYILGFVIDRHPVK